MRQLSRIASRLRVDDPVMRRWPIRREKTRAQTHVVRVRTAIDWKGKSLSARPARKTSLFGKSAFGGPTETKKARSVVALSRDPPLRAEFAGSPPAAGFCTDGLPASCPDPRRPTHDHRHVRFGQNCRYALSPRTQAVFDRRHYFFSVRRSEATVMKYGLLRTARGGP